MTILQAAKEYIGRKNRNIHPDGKFDNGGRWYPSEAEKCNCCNVRPPSRRHPYSLLIHCRTAKHVANLFNVDYKDLMKEVKNQE